MTDLLARISLICKLDKKNITEKALKTTEECGELAEAVLSSINAPTCGYKGLTRQDVLEEAVDTATCAISVAVMAGFAPEAIMAMFHEKLDRWERKIQDAEEKRIAAETALAIVQHFNEDEKI